MRSLSKFSKREPSRGRVFYNRSGGPAPKLQFRTRSVTVVKNTSGSGFLCFENLLKLLLIILPLVLFFSYHPVIALGADETTNFELSLPLIWLVVFDVVGFWLMVRKRVLFRGLKGKWWLWLLFPIWVTLSVVWSVNVTRGVLTVGILWLICLAIYAMWNLRELFDEKFKVRFWKWFLGATLAVCAWCVVQCVLDLMGVGREYSLMCAGCTYRTFGFPHPNGFAAEPQFMGNLLLAPAMIVAWAIVSKQNHKKLKRERSRDSHFYNGSGGLFIITVTLFLTFSRGAIYAFGVGLVFLTAFVVMREKKQRREIVKRVGWVWLVAVLAFLFTLNLQGIMAELSPTSDTFGTGVAKAVNHLSLGVIDVRGEEKEAGDNFLSDGDVVEKPVENFEETGEEEAVFDGYVAESTDTRVRLTGAAFTVWRQNFATAMFGVGLGGAGQALYNNGLSLASKEIVQNEYASLLLETGVVGISLFLLTVWLIVRVALRGRVTGLMLALLVAYGVTLCFFSGLANALQIYLMLGVVGVIGAKEKNLVRFVCGRSWCRRFRRRGVCRTLERLRDLGRR